MAEKKIAVIGAGLSGMAAAARIANAGYKVDLFEKNDRAGGKAGSLEFDGFRFDHRFSDFLLSCSNPAGHPWYSQMPGPAMVFRRGQII